MRVGNAKTVERPALGIAGADLVGEDAGGSGRAAVVEASVAELGVLDEREVDAGELARRLWLAADDR